MRLNKNLVSVVNITTATCTRPTLASNTYTLSESKAQYAVNETYEIYCAPGYIISGTTTLVCQAKGTWSADSPTCTNAGEKCFYTIDKVKYT